MEYEIKVNRLNRLVYIRKEILKDMGHEWTMVRNRNAAVVYPRDCDLRRVIRSVQTILRDLRLRLAEQGETRS